MGRILDPQLRNLADQWSAVVQELLDGIGSRSWPPRKVRRSVFGKPELVVRYVQEGPVQRGNRIGWAVSHTSRPSTFDDQGNLSEGERQYWIVWLEAGTPALFTVEGSQIETGIPAERGALSQALMRSWKAGPRQQRFYGNKGPLSQPQSGS